MKLRKPMFVVRKLSIFCLVGIVVGVMAYAASAAELPAGTIINKANLDKVMNDTFEGKTIRSMLIASQEYQIRNWALQMKLRHSKLPKMGKAFLEATEKYAKDVKFDPKAREVTGWKAGLPFPEASPVTSSPAAVAEFIKDPYAGDKVIWNYYYGHQGGRTQHCPHSWLLVSADTGLERRQDWFWLRYYTKGRMDGPGKPPVVDDALISRTLFFVTAPYDMRGIGIFALRYDSPKLEDNWVYVKSVRRTRRLSGGAWVDPVDGLDMLNDEIWIINARPSWYKSFKLLDKRWVLVIANDFVDWQEGAKTVEEEFPSVDLKNWPHWNPALVPGNEWEPREVWVVEGIPPAYHPHSRRVLYADVHAPPTIYIGEGYDKEGKLWKYVQYTIGSNNAETARENRKTQRGKTVRMIPPSPTEETCNGITPEGFYIDFKRRHASHHYDRIWDANPGFGPNDVTLGHLEAAGK
ncbi:MAG: DUF1329 domain-containing protein [Syntrophales bacterium]|nr:DUF1329 domain-containing protein [Syntrophales bacterium]